MVQTREPIHKFARANRTLPDQRPQPLTSSVERSSYKPRPEDFPTSVNRLVGRERELSLVRDLLIDHGARIVTITGEPGIGKTRLAAAVADGLAAAQSVCWVDLGHIHSPHLVLRTIGDQLGFAPVVASQLDRLIQGIGSERLLLVLDSFEHLLAAREQIALLVSRCPHVSLLVTNGAPLRLGGEHVLNLSPLSVLAPEADPSGVATRGEAVQLFVDRAAAAVPGFEVHTEADAAAVVEICQRLEGIPLAIELAAARLSLLRTPRALLTRMDWGLLHLLVGGAVTGASRHTSMVSAIDSSYQRLRDPERAFLRRLSVFDDSFTPLAAACVNSDRSAPAVDDIRALQVLVDSGLIQPRPSRSTEPRFGMRAIVREYARGHLVRSGEVDIVERRYVSWFVNLAQAAENEVRGPRQAAWLNRLTDEQFNIRSVLRWADENEDVEVGATIASALGIFWVLRAPAGEGRQWLTRFSQRARPLEPELHARLLSTTGAILVLDGDYAEAGPLLEEAHVIWTRLGQDSPLAWTLLLQAKTAAGLGAHDMATDAYTRSLGLFREAGDAAGIGWAMLGLALVARQRGLPGEVWTSLFAQTVATWRQVDDRWGLATALHHAACASYRCGALDRAAELFDECIPIYRELDFARGTGRSLRVRGDLERTRNACTLAEPFYSEALQLLRKAGDARGVARAQLGLAYVYVNRLEIAPAAPLLRDSLAYFAEHGDDRAISACVAACARVALAVADLSLASNLLAVSGALCKHQGPAEAAEIKRTRDAIRRQLGEKRLDAPSAPAVQISTSTAVSLCRALLETAAAVTPPDVTTQNRVSGLTVRERQVVVLIARGLKDREIAAALVMGRATASWHVRNVLSKLGLSRAQVGVWALSKGLLDSAPG